jgi:hypothetical protein
LRFFHSCISSKGNESSVQPEKFKFKFKFKLRFKPKFRFKLKLKFKFKLVQELARVQDFILKRSNRERETLSNSSASSNKLKGF